MTPVPTSDCAVPAKISNQSARLCIASFRLQDRSESSMLPLTGISDRTDLVESPSGRRPMDSGLVRTNNMAGKMRIDHAVNAMTTHAVRHPKISINVAP